MFEITSSLNENSVLIFSNLFPLGPFVKPIFLSEPIRIYYPNLNRNIIGIENKNKTAAKVRYHSPLIPKLSWLSELISP